jgi:hypothetical protein
LLNTAQAQAITRRFRDGKDGAEAGFERRVNLSIAYFPRGSVSLDPAHQLDVAALFVYQQVVEPNSVPAVGLGAVIASLVFHIHQIVLLHYFAAQVFFNDEPRGNRAHAFFVGPQGTDVFCSFAGFFAGSSQVFPIHIIPPDLSMGLTG